MLRCVLSFLPNPERTREASRLALGEVASRFARGLDGPENTRLCPGPSSHRSPLTPGLLASHLPGRTLTHAAGHFLWPAKVPQA
jgi:hypothetical protein